MQDPIRQPAGWNHHHRPPQISLSLCIFIPLHFQLLNIKNRFLHYMCVLEMGLMAAAEKGVCVCVCVVGWGGVMLADGWMAGLEMTSGLTECLSITTHSLGYRWSLIFPNWRISASLYMTAGARQFACTTDNKRACACQNRWRCVTVSTQCCLLLAWPSTPCHVSFHNQGEGKMGQRNHPAFLPVFSCCCFSAFPSYFVWFFACLDHLACCLSLFLYLLLAQQHNSAQI